MLPSTPGSSWTETGSLFVAGANCYAFALGEQGDLLMPGRLAIRRKNDNRAGNRTYPVAPLVLGLLEMDGLVPLTDKSQLRGVNYPVLIFSSESDYHCVRPDRSGGWWHKLGQTPAQRKFGLPTWVRGYRLVGIYLVDLDRVRSDAPVEITMFAAEQAEKVALTNREGSL